MKHELIRVIVAGFPIPLASQVARSCKKRGMSLAKFGLAGNDHREESIEIPEIGKLRLYSFNDSKAREQISAEVEEAKKDHGFALVADVSNRQENVDLYNSCKIPFVMQSSDHKSRVEIGEQTRQLAVISDDFNKYAVAFDSIMREWGRRFPGMFRGFELVDNGLIASRHLSHSFDDLLDTKLSKNYQHDSSNAAYIEGHAEQEFSFKKGSGSTSFTFKRTAKPEEYADGMAEAALFLAHQAEVDQTPRVYSMIDVARRAPLMVL